MGSGQVKLAGLILKILSIQARNALNLEVSSLHTVILSEISKLLASNMNMDSCSHFPDCHRYLSTTDLLGLGSKMAHTLACLLYS